MQLEHVCSEKVAVHDDDLVCWCIGYTRHAAAQPDRNSLPRGSINVAGDIWITMNNRGNVQLGVDFVVVVSIVL